MKRFLAIAITSIYSLSIQAQEGFVFKILIKPNTTYISEMSTSSITETSFNSGEALSSSMNNKSLVENTTKMKSIMVAESQKEDGNIPISIRYEDATADMLVNGQRQSMALPITDAIIKANYTADNHIVMDTIMGQSLNPQFKQMMGTMLEQMAQQIDFPENPIKVGDAFTTEKPMTIPAPGMKPIEMKIKSTYKLNEIKDGKAFFTFQQDITLESVQEGFSMDAKGSGTGSCKYDIRGQYLSYLKSELPMQLTMNMSENMASIVNSTTITEVKMSVE